MHTIDQVITIAAVTTAIKGRAPQGKIIKTYFPNNTLAR